MVPFLPQRPFPGEEARRQGRGHGTDREPERGGREERTAVREQNYGCQLGVRQLNNERK